MQPKMMDRPGCTFGHSPTGDRGDAEQKSATHGAAGGLLGVTIHSILVKFELPC
jgi:hypothetical protein